MTLTHILFLSSGVLFTLAYFTKSDLLWAVLLITGLISLAIGCLIKAYARFPRQ